MMKNKDKAVTTLTKGVEFLLKKNKVTYFRGLGSFVSKNQISIKDQWEIRIPRTSRFSVCFGLNFNEKIDWTYGSLGHLNFNQKIDREYGSLGNLDFLFVFN